MVSVINIYYQRIFYGPSYLLPLVNLSSLKYLVTSRTLTLFTESEYITLQTHPNLP